MTIHREGYPSIIITLLFVAILNIIVHYFLGEYNLIKILTYILSAFLLLVILQFFRSPRKNTIINENNIIAPADGKVVVIEEVEEPEFFKDKRIQVSIFMSPLNVHINHYPISGVVKHVKYHPGKYLVAWHPKSSTENERTTIVVEHKNQKSLLIRQIAGAMARRIVYYSKESESANQGKELGFIKFGSRVDIFFPLDAKIKVALNQKVTGAETVIGSFE